MGGQDTQQAEQEDFSSAQEYFDTLFVSALEYGMTPEQFWTSIFPEEFWAYQQLYIKRKIRSDLETLEKASYEGWVYGTYVAQAISANLAKGARYPEEPIDFSKAIEEVTMTREEKQKQVELISRQQKMEMLARFDRKRRMEEAKETR